VEFSWACWQEYYFSVLVRSSQANSSNSKALRELLPEHMPASSTSSVPASSNGQGNNSGSTQVTPRLLACVQLWQATMQLINQPDNSSSAGSTFLMHAKSLRQQLIGEDVSNSQRLMLYESLMQHAERLLLEDNMAGGSSQAGGSSNSISRSSPVGDQLLQNARLLLEQIHNTVEHDDSTALMETDTYQSAPSSSGSKHGTKRQTPPEGSGRADSIDDDTMFLQDSITGASYDVVSGQLDDTPYSNSGVRDVKKLFAQQGFFGGGSIPWFWSSDSSSFHPVPFLSGYEGAKPPSVLCWDQALELATVFGPATDRGPLPNCPFGSALTNFRVGMVQALETIAPFQGSTSVQPVSQVPGIRSLIILLKERASMVKGLKSSSGVRDPASEHR